MGGISIAYGINVLDLTKPGSYAAGTEVSKVTDTKGYEEMIVIQHAAAMDATGTLDIQAQECDTEDGTFTDITGAAFPQITTATDNAIYAARLNLNKLQRYIRFNSVVATAAGIFALSCILGAKTTVEEPLKMQFDVP